MRLIDADALKEFIGKVRAKYDFFTDEERSRYEAHSKALELLNIYLDYEPTIDAVSVVHGEWICHEGKWIDFDYYPTKFECNQCHHYVDVASDKRYCPNCGAKMDGERKESE